MGPGHGLHSRYNQVTPAKVAAPREKACIPECPGLAAQYEKRGFTFRRAVVTAPPTLIRRRSSRLLPAPRSTI